MEPAKDNVERVVDRTDSGAIRTYFGTPICTGPGKYRLMLTWPPVEEGHIVEIPHERIEDISPATQDNRSQEPKLA